MADQLIEIADGFWNIRGSFKVAGLLDVGTQASLARLRSGDFALLDSYPLRGDVACRVLSLTDQGRAVRLILNLHPFHTTHVAASAAQFPNARLYGTRRHKRLAPGLRWEALHTEDGELHAQLEADFRLSVPRGVDFIPRSQHVHFSSVLARHEASRTLHVDDTLSWSALPVLGGLTFHPTLRFALQKRPGAAMEFRAWAEQLVEQCGDVSRLCTAHARKLPGAARPVADQVRGALARVSGLLDAHARRYG
jgi:hypothetical protein